jgi:hypothetical protein
MAEIEDDGRRYRAEAEREAPDARDRFIGWARKMPIAQNLESSSQMP